MKKIYLIFMILLLVGLMFSLAYGQDFVDANQITIEWDPVAPIDPADVIAYQVFLSPYPFVGDRQDVNTPWEEIEVTLAVQSTLTFTTEGEYVAGVRTIRSVEGGPTIKYSDMIWSDIDGVPNPFVLRYYESPDSPVNIRYL